MTKLSVEWLGAVAVMAAVAGSPPAQAFDLRSLFSSSPPTTGSVPAVAPPTQPPGAGSTSDWSGESGASGHPAMQADAIRAAAANFRGCLESLWPLAARRGVPR